MILRNEFASIDDELIRAIDNADEARAVRLIAQGADVNAKHPTKNLPLIHYTTGLGYTEIVDSMLASGRCDLTVRDFMGRLPSALADLVKDHELADRLAEEQAGQFRAKNMDPRSPDNPDHGNWKWDL